MFNPNNNYLDFYSPNDATIEFYGRIKTLINSNSIVLDLGAGRGSWIQDDSKYRIQIRSFKNIVKKIIGLDVSSDIFLNTSTDENFLIINGILPLENNSVDIIICDFVFEHINDTKLFFTEINRVLKKDGFICARTPHKSHYIAIFSNIINQSLHNNILKYVQKDRLKEDIFPAFYKLNTMHEILQSFPSYKNYSYLYSCDPSYFFNNYLIYKIMYFLHSILPKKFSSNILVFLQKP
jgi:ubiquinone/menaquinone biosynthesis C-methylase UbiE